MITDDGTGSAVHIDLDEDHDETANEPAIDEDAPVAASTSATDDEDVVDEDADLDPADRLPKNAVRNSDGSVTLTLRYPRHLKTKKNGKTRERVFSELVFHRLTGADQRVIAGAADDMQSVIAFARSTRLNQAVMNALFDKMDAADIQAGGQVINNFFASGTRTRTGSRGSA